MKNRKHEKRRAADGPPSLGDLKEGPPGGRFQRLYERRQASSHGPAKNAAFIVTGIVMLAVGIATYPIPVIPSDFIIVSGLALVAQCSSRGARLLDALELRVRRRCSGAIRLWKCLPGVAKVLISVTASGALGALSFVLIRVITD